jgi:multidrug efflux pump subunit AcrB
MGFNLSKWALENRSLVVYMMIAATIAGLSTFYRLGRDEDPPFVIKTMVVQAAWPGATLEDTLQQLTDRLERTLQETPSLDYLRSYTSPGSTTIFVNLKGDTPAAKIPSIWYDVRTSVGDIRRTLPDGAIGPEFNDKFGDVFGIIYGVTADGFSHRELRDYVEDIRSRLMHVPDVTKIEILGAQDEKIFVEFSVQQLAGLGIDRSALITALAAQNVVAPSGVLKTGDERLTLRVSGAFESEQDILAVNFVANGRLIRLRDIAQVHRAYADPPQPMFRVNGKPAIGIAVAMREGGDILTLGRSIERAMREIRANLPLGIEPVLVADQSAVVDHAIHDFTTSLLQAIAIIMAVSFVSLGVRAGAVIALSIPLTLAIVFPVMELTGIDLQRISLGALIIALGLLVDDAMTTVDVMSSRLAAGDSKEEAATFAYKTLAFPMLTGSFVTAAGFIPIGFAKSSAGEYTFSIFAVVSFSVVVSWIVAVLFAPLLGVVLLSKPEAKPSGKPGAILGRFRRFLIGAMRMRWVTIGVTLACFVAAVLASPLVPREFFPPSDRPDLLVDLSLPQNASIYASEETAERLEGLLEGDPDVDRWSTYVGRGAIRFYLPLNVELANNFFTQAVVVAKDVAARERLQKKLEAALAEKFPNAVSRVSPLGLGPPIGWPVQYRVSGPDVAELRDIALQLAQIVATDPGARHVNFDWMEPARMVRIRIDQDQTRLMGLSTQAIAAVMNSVVTGKPVTQVRDGIYLVDVLTRATDEDRLSLSTLRSLQIPLPNGRTVPLGQIARFDFAQQYPLVWRRDRVPTLTVQTDVASGVLPETVVDALAPEVAKLNSNLPASYRIAVGGTVEESQKSQASVNAVVPLMMFVTITLLMIQLRSFNRLLLVFAVVPMGLIGVVAAMLLFHQPLGFVAILGILSLIGMIARNAVILIEQIDFELAQGLDVWNAVIEAALSRLRPIMLTAISTILGLIPIAVTIFWGPMAIAVMGGLLVATVLTLIFLPALYVTWFRIKEPIKAQELRLRVEATTSAK